MSFLVASWRPPQAAASAAAVPAAAAADYAPLYSQFVD